MRVVVPFLAAALTVCAGGSAGARDVAATHAGAEPGRAGAAASVVVTLPVASVGPTDGLPTLLSTRTAYRADVLVWVSPGYARPSVRFVGRGLSVADCTAVQLRGPVTRWRCSVRAGRGGGSLVVRVRAGGETVTASFAHGPQPHDGSHEPGPGAGPAAMEVATEPSTGE